LYGKRDVSKREYTSFFDWNCFEKIIENPWFIRLFVI
jgi:hypothetical protein